MRRKDTVKSRPVGAEARIAANFESRVALAKSPLGRAGSWRNLATEHAIFVGGDRGSLQIVHPLRWSWDQFEW